MKSNPSGLAALALATSAATPAMAQQQEEEHKVSYNAAIVSEYRYRGLSQTRFDPAAQAGADYVHTPTGLYAGTWASTIQWTRDAGGSGDFEWDFYGGKKGDLGAGVRYDVGALYYYYPGNQLGPNANTFELYGQLGYGPAWLKYSHSTTNLFGTPDSKNSGYFDLGANIDLPHDFVLNLHAGHQRVRHNSSLSYADYKVGISRDFGAAVVSLAFIKATNGNYRAPSGKGLGRPAAVLAISRTF